ncbi:HAD family hydrolase [Paenibacillus sedimenti]|uniref:HAD family hydrolase n=1 Tax=Paenibacillus sedimenti TaxID=2770274 RepID=A0A926QIR4_9BACL|nr:HAD family hydrolase [Paenibacillus sedimenti]MBD0379888.1 HAD family hydrolase [Paenibacillus sedimenti]
MMKCIIFDLDGTIGNTLPLCIAAFKKSIEPLAGRSLSDQEIIATFGPSEEGTVQALIPDYYEQGVEDYLKHYRDLHMMCEAPFDGIVEVIEFAKNKNVRLAMVTGKGERSTEVTLEVFGLRSYFDIIETGSPLGPRKVQGIAKVVEHLGIAPEECIYVGDTPSDILSSREAKIPVIAAAWAETADKEQLLALKPDALFTTVEEFKRYIEQACT